MGNAVPRATGERFRECLVRTLRRERLDYLISLIEKHLRRILKEWVTHRNRARPTQVREPGILEPDESMPIPCSAKRSIPGIVELSRDLFWPDFINSTGSRKLRRENETSIFADHSLLVGFCARCATSGTK